MAFKYKELSGGICAAKGFVAAGIHCGIRKNKSKLDLALVKSDVLCNCASVYTQNKVQGSPILVTKNNIMNGKAQALIVNSGIANTCMPNGIQKAETMCKIAGEALGIHPSDVVVASTGVIGEELPIKPITEHIDELVTALSLDGHKNASKAIMTTDTYHKEYAIAFQIGGQTVHIGGMCKGSGMIHPNMATMLCFLSTDADVTTELLQKALKEVADETFNMVSVDGDTSTNDMVTVFASGKAGNERIDHKNEAYIQFKYGLNAVMTYLSKEIARDGEGATKLIECTVSGAKNVETARYLAKSVITSSLVKTAVFGADANWGRIICALGYSNGDFSIENLKIELAAMDQPQKITVCDKGAGVAFSEETARDILIQDEVRILVNLNEGSAAATAWGCDLSYEYVRINGDYRT